MTSKRREFWIVEHIWRALRNILLLVGTWSWIYVEYYEHSVFACFAIAIMLDQFKGAFCYLVESIIKVGHQHGTHE